MRYLRSLRSYSCLVILCFLALNLTGALFSSAQTTAAAALSNVQLQVDRKELSLTLPVTPPSRPTPVRVRVELLNPEDGVRADSTSEIVLRPKQKTIAARLVKPFDKIPPDQMADLHWLRVRYEVRTMDGEILASGIEALRTPTTEPFVLTAAASRVALEGHPYRVQAHAKASNGKPLGGVDVKGDVTWDAETGEEKIFAKALTNAAGNATLEFAIPHVAPVESGDLTIAAKYGVVARSLEREVDFQTGSYLLLDTDKDIYQPGQKLHARMLRFDSKRKAVENEELEVRISDEDDTLVSKQTVTTNPFGVAHVDWEIPANVRQGNYTIQVSVSGQEDNWKSVRAGKSVHIYRYDLPNFRVSAQPDHSYYLPGQNAEVKVAAEYLFGKPVTRGNVRVVEEEERNWNFHKQQWETKEGQVQAGELDRDGHFTARFDLTQKHKELGNTYDNRSTQFLDVDLAAYVTDLTTGRTEQRRFQLRVTKKPIHVYIQSLGINGQQGIAPTFWVSTYYADGTPARCKVALSLYDEDDEKLPKLPLRTVETNKYGLAKAAELKIPNDEDRDSLLAEATDAKGLTGRNSERYYRYDEDLGVVEVTTSHAIHKAGDPIEVTVRSTQPSLRVVVEAVRDGVVLATQQTRLHNGSAFLIFPYDARFTDEVTVFAFSLDQEWDYRSQLEGSRTVLYPKNRQLGVAVQFDKNEHRPGEDAMARIAVQSSDKAGTESVLGVKIVDRAVEERAETDRDFGQRGGWGWWRWSLWSSDEGSGFGGVTRDDLDQVDLNEPVPADLDLVAEYILLSAHREDLEMLEARSSLTAQQAFAKIIGQQFEKLENGLNRWNEQGKNPRDVAELEAVGKEFGVDVPRLRDPWDTPYRYQLGFSGSYHTLTVTSAGPDKQFGTKDDFIAQQTSRAYFLRYGTVLDTVSRHLIEDEGRFVHDRATLQAAMLKRGIDFDALRDPWGKPYEAQFSVQGSYYVTEIVSHGEETAARAKKEDRGTVVWTGRVDYFVKSREYINKILTAHLNAGGTYPSNEEQFKSVLRKAGVDLDQLRDPWGNPYYTEFHKVAQYGDRIKIQQRDASGQRVGEPVTLIRQEVHIMSRGPDQKQGTGDDFLVASYSMLISEQSAQDLQPQPAPANVNLAANKGGITGVVTDPTGAVVEGTTIEATREGTDEKYTTKTDYYGRFELKDIPPGVYDLKADRTGFRVLEVKAVPVFAANLTELSFELSVGGTAQTVEVAASTVSLQTESASMSVAVNGSDIAKLAKIVPGIATVTKSGAMSTPRLRQDFPETMLWEPALITDRHGHAKLNFKIADNITTWKLSAVASTKNGELGHAEKDLRAFQPFFLEHDPPRILTQGDEIAYPVVLRNYLDRAQTLKAWIKPESWFTLLGPAEMPVKVDAGDAASAVFRYRALAAITDGKQQVSAANSEISDAAQKPVDVHPFGRPAPTTASTIVDKKGTLSLQVPDDAIPGSLRARVKVYPNLLAHLVETLEAGLERPYGCGEQTISSTYPSLLVAELYAKSDKKPPVALRAQRYLVAGYERLLRYQGESGGFSYWGHGEAPDLALTAYALEFLHHAATLIEVDDKVPDAAERWVLQQQNSDGSWRGRWNKNDKDAMLLTAYTAQILVQVKEEDATGKSQLQSGLAHALDFLSVHRDLADEPYAIASYALAAKSAGNDKAASSLLDSLRKSVHYENGSAYWALERNTPFYGWGRTGRLESTALALRALASSKEAKSADQDLIRQGLLFLLRNEDKDGMWWCGQTTVHVLKTLLSMVAMGEREAGAKLTVRVNGQDAATLDLPAGQTVVPPLEVDVTKLVKPGANQVELETSGEGMMSAQIVADSYVPWKDDATTRSEPNATSALKLVVTYSTTKGTTDDKIECRIRAERLGHQGYGMMLGEIGLPPGADVDRESLEQAIQGNYAVYRYDVTPDRVILYLWPTAGGSEFTFKFRPRFAMHAETAPSLLYDYYNPEASVTLKPSRFEVTPGK